MKTTLHYSTFVTLNVHALGMTVTMDMGCKPLSEILEYVDCIFNNATMFHGDCVEKVVVCDSNTGELIAECDPDRDDKTYDDWDYNEDMGFDPYLGCYSDDC